MDQRKKRRKGKAKKIVIICCIAAAAAGAGFWFYHRQQMQNGTDMASAPVYEYPQRMDMENTYTSNGRVISTTQAVSETPSGYDQGYKVKSVLVKVGDSVKKGDPLYTIDTASVETDLAQNQKKLALQQQQNSIDAQSKSKAAASAKAAAAQQAADSQRAIRDAAMDTEIATRTQGESIDAVNEAQLKHADAQNKFNEAQAKYDQAKQTYDAAEKKYETLKSQNDAAQAKINTAQQLSDIASARATRIQAQGSGEGDEGYDQANGEAAQRAEELAQLKAANQQLSSDLSEAKDDADQAKTDMDDAKTALDAAQTELDNAKDAVDKAQDTVNTNAADTLSKQRAQEQSASDGASKDRDAQTTADTAQTDLQSQIVTGQTNLIDTQTAIAQDQQKLDGSTIYAGIDGTVTEINVAAGQTYSGTDAVVISDLHALTIATDVDGAHVIGIHTGMKVKMTTDASGTNTLSGKVTSVADFPTSTDSVSVTTTSSTSTGTSSGSSGTGLLNTKQKVYYRVTIQPDDGFSQLREGMNTKITFMLAEAKDAIAVPKDAIYTNPDGSAYVLAVDNGSMAGSSDTAAEAETGSGAAEETSAAVNTAGDGTGTDSSAAGDGMAAEGTADQSMGADDSGLSAAGTDAAAEAPTVQLAVTTGIEQGEMVQITSGNVTEDMQLVGPNTYSSYGGTSDSDSSTLLEGIYD